MWQTVYELVGEGVPAGMQARLTNKAATSLKLGNAPVMILILHRPLAVMRSFPLCFHLGYSPTIECDACPPTPVLTSFANQAFPTHTG